MLVDMTPEAYQAWLENISREIDERRLANGACGPLPHSTFVPWPGGGYPGETDEEYRIRKTQEAE